MKHAADEADLLPGMIEPNAEIDLPPAVRLQHRRLGVLIIGCIFAAMTLELAGRALHAGWAVGYGLTGTLTWAALVVWSAGSIYTVRTLHSPVNVIRLVALGGASLIFSQSVSLLHYFGAPCLGGGLLTGEPLRVILEESTFVAGLACLFAGFYRAVFETRKATVRTGLKQLELESLNRVLEERVQVRTLALTEANEALSRRNAQREAILNTTLDGFCILDREGRFLEVNKALAHMTAYSQDELMRMNLRDIEANESPADIVRHMREIMEKASAQFETRHRRKDGSFFWVEVSTNYLRPMDVFFCFLRDISERKRNEETILASEAKYRELVQNANSIILRMNARGQITFFNEFAQRFFGFSEAEVLHRNIIGFIVPERDANGQDMGAMFEDMFTNPARYANHENENIVRGGERVRISWTNKPIFDAAGNLHEMLCVGNDITARTRAERLLAEQRLKMVNSARLSALGIMAGGIAHEINNPLAIISAGAEQLESLAENMNPKQERIASIIQLIRRNSTRIQRIVRGLRGVSRDASNDPFVPAGLAGIIADMEELCRERFKNHGISLEIEFPCTDIEIECRPSQLCQVIINLLNNALDAIDGREEKWVRIAMRETEEDVRIDVTDSGPGLPAEMVDKVFVPFFTTKSDQKGMGLGLSLSRTMVEAHHGIIFVDSSCANTRFTIILPRKQPARS